MLFSRPPLPALRPFVRRLWAVVPAPGQTALPAREHVLPTGCMHLALRLDGPPLRVFAAAGDHAGTTFPAAVVGGARVTHYIREVGVPARSLGAQLEPGASLALFGCPADALAGAHTPLDALWGHEAELLRERLAAVGDGRRALDLLEALLVKRLPTVRGMHPGVAASLHQLRQGAPVRAAVQASGLSHRHLIARFREATGLAPKEHVRILRLEAALRLLAAGNGLADVAAQAGYSDQPHFNQDFRAHTGMTPAQWRLAAPTHPNHVSAPAAR